MFKPNSAKDRINYGEALIPPVGFFLECAIGTTYSLDLETLTAISISMGLVEDTDSELIRNPIGMLNALQKVSDKIVIFCEAGQIKLPSKPNALCLMLEKMVVPVTLPQNKSLGGFPAFHPKTWVLEYGDNDGNKKYRFIVMSRNLTFDHSWDVAVALDGNNGGTNKEDPILDFLTFLRLQLNRALNNYDKQNEVLEHMIKSLHNVQFEFDDKKFSECFVLPLGIGKQGYNMPSDELFCENFHELVVMSPFITGSVIKSLNDDEKNLTGTKRTLITRRSELPKISAGEADNFDVYVLKDSIIDGESVLSEDEDKEEEVINKQDIHAKVFLRRKNNTVDLYLGSMNATYSAINANVEMMLCLRTRRGVIDGEKLLDDIMGEDRDENPKKNPFVLVFPEEYNETKEQTSKDLAEQLVKRVCRFKMHAVTSKSEDGLYSIELSINCDELISGVSIQPLRSNRSCGFERNIVFEHLKELEVSEFYVVSVTVDDYSMERVIMIPTAGIPDGREVEIIKSVIKDKRSFIEYVSFILGEDYVQSFIENKRVKGDYIEWNTNYDFPAVYEKMLKTSVSDPDRLKEIKYITKVIKEEDIIPSEFLEMYQVFCATLGI